MHIVLIFYAREIIKRLLPLYKHQKETLAGTAKHYAIDRLQFGALT
jgi:hypothetical protein